MINFKYISIKEEYMKHNKYWFKPKKYGYGATPTTWEGWLVIVFFIGYLFSISILLEQGNVSKYIFYFLAGLVVLLIITKKKTQGGMKWNWGKKR